MSIGVQHNDDGSISINGHVPGQLVFNTDGTTSGKTVPDPRTAGDKVHATVGTVRAMSRTMLFARDIHHGDRASLIRVSKGMATPNDGDMIPATTHPEVVKGILRGDQATCSDTEWLNDPYKRGMWSRGTAYLDDQGKPQGWVRMPDLNQAKEGSLPPPFARGGSDSKAGSIGKDQMRKLEGQFRTHASGAALETSGVFKEGTQLASDTGVNNTGSKRLTVAFDSSLGLPEGHTGIEFAPWHIYGVSYSITSNGVMNEGAIDAEQVMGEVLLDRGRIAALESGSRLKAATGYKIHADGLIEQWGETVSLAADSGVNITFPTAFPERVTGIQLTPRFDGGNDTGDIWLYYRNPTLQGFRLTNGSANVAVGSWRAYGY